MYTRKKSRRPTTDDDDRRRRRRERIGKDGLRETEGDGSDDGGGQRSARRCSSASSSSGFSAVMRTDLDAGNFLQPSRAGFAVVEAEKKKKSAMEVDKMLSNLRARPHRTMDVDKLLEKLKKQRIDKEKENARLKQERDARSQKFSFEVEMVQDGETVTDARSLWKKAVQSGEGTEIHKAIAAMNALSEVQLPTGESNTLVSFFSCRARRRLCFLLVILG